MKNPEDLMYLRPDDLSDEERAELDAWLSEHPEAAPEAAALAELRDDLAALPETDAGPSLDALLDRLAAAGVTTPAGSPRQDREAVPPAVPTEAPAAPAPANRRWYAPLVAGLAMAAAALLVVPALLQDPDPMRDRGNGGGPGPGDVTLRAVAEGPNGTRELAPGDGVATNERVAFYADARVPGHLDLSENDVVFWPAAGADWQVTPGQHVPGGSSPLTWRPDAGIERGIYQARLCAGPDAAPPCATATIELRW